MLARSEGFSTRANDASEGPAAADSSTLVNDLKDALKECVAQVRGERRFWEATGGYIKEHGLPDLEAFDKAYQGSIYPIVRAQALKSCSGERFDRGKIALLSLRVLPNSPEFLSSEGDLRDQ